VVIWAAPTSSSATRLANIAGQDSRFLTPRVGRGARKDHDWLHGGRGGVTPKQRLRYEILGGRAAATGRSREASSRSRWTRSAPARAARTTSLIVTPAVSLIRRTSSRSSCVSDTCRAAVTGALYALRCAANGPGGGTVSGRRLWRRRRNTPCAVRASTEPASTGWRSSARTAPAASASRDGGAAGVHGASGGGSGCGSGSRSRSVAVSSANARSERTGSRSSRLGSCATSAEPAARVALSRSP
jgi:hypothetical protein